MRISAPHAVATVLTAGTLLLGAGTAFADSPQPSPTAAAAGLGSPAHVAVSASQVQAGQAFHVDGTCAIPDSGSTPLVKGITSPGFAGGKARLINDRPDAFTADATAVVKPGTYEVTLQCSNGTASTSFEVVSSPTPDPSPKPSPSPKPTTASDRSEPARVAVSSVEVKPGTEVRVSGTVATDTDGNPIGTVKSVESAGFQGRFATLDKTGPLAFTGHATAVTAPGWYRVKLIGTNGHAETSIHVLEQAKHGNSGAGGKGHHGSSHDTAPIPNGAPATGRLDSADRADGAVDLGAAVASGICGLVLGIGCVGLATRRRRPDSDQ
ncbi:hypothetical protein ACFZAV_45250 [Streptomyces sp. NPDC008343]|uniref:hypothetical protein n=1 Tax=Streptomyces sp. NPDC008343 TaxID=3364828 RepID=UPI0036E45243